MMLLWLPFLAGLLPLVAMLGAFWLGVAYEVLPSCIPFVDGCVSISATGRKPPGSFLFRATMLPESALLAAVWYFTALWLRSLHAGVRRSSILIILLSGVLGAVALAVYVTFLGSKEPIYEFMRRSGIYFAFLGQWLAQLFTVIALLRICRDRNEIRLKPFARTMLGICIAVLALGIVNLILKSVLDDPDAAENRIEWTAALLMQFYFFVLFVAWRRTGFRASVTTGVD